MIDHIGIPVSDYERSKVFFSKVLATLGAELVMEVPAEQTDDGHAACGFGRDGNPSFWIYDGGRAPARPHFAFTASSREQVQAFHREALAQGAADHGAPGLRPAYGEHYYAAFVLDADDYNFEAVCHAPAASRGVGP